MSEPQSATPDRVQLRGVSAIGHHGVLPSEKRDGQPFVVDVTCWLLDRRAAAEDDLLATVHYGDLAEQIVADITGESVDLIEALAQRIAGTCLTHPAVASAEVTVHKPQAPITVAFADVSVTVTRSRSER